jgi:sigma-B regulation protein RsbU (phosphoserine phosphatase)
MEGSAGVSLRTRVTVLGLVGAVVLACVALLVRAAYVDVRDSGAQVSDRLVPASDLAADLVVAYDRVDRDSRTYVLTGNASSRSDYLAARARVDLDLVRLAPLLAGDQVLTADLDRVRLTSAAWLPPTVEPAVAARDAGPLSLPALASFLARTSSGYAQVSEATVTLQSAVDAERNDAFDALSDVARRLALALTAAGVALAALVLAAFLLVRRWVLTPLDALRGQLRDVAREGHRDRVIEPSGPPELWAVGADAEAMRRALVVEADAARAADEGLVQEGPVVAAIRAELETAPDPTAPGLTIHGELHAAEGVLAGDWWGVVPLDGARTALVVIDVSGHGALAGLVTLRLRAVMSVALRSGFDAATALTRASASFADTSDGRFATALVVVLDPVASTLSWANAGHPAGWLLPDGDTARRLLLRPTGPLISALGGEWEQARAAFDAGSVVLAWSDGLTEERTAERELTDAALADVVAGLSTSDPAELVGGLLATLRQDAPEWRRDDITVVAVRRTP